MIDGGMAAEQRGVNLLDGGVPNYSVYETSVGKHMSIGSLEPQFYAELISLTGVDQALAMDPEKMRAALTETFKTKTQAEWSEIFDGTDACVAPILPFTMEEAWLTRFPNEKSVHLRQFPKTPKDWRIDAVGVEMERLRKVRAVVTGALEIARAEKRIGSSLEAHPVVWIADE